MTAVPLDWGPNSPFPPAVRREIEAQHNATSVRQTQADTAEVARLRTEVAELRKQLVAQKKFALQVARTLGETCNYLFGCRDDPDDKDPAIVKVIRAHAYDELKNWGERISALERSRIKYLGVHEHGVVYPEGAMVTRAGSLWYATKETREAPGEGVTAWTLAVKRGGAG